MHELSIAMSMVDLAVAELEKNGGTRVETLYLKLGGLSGVVKDSLLFSWEAACSGTPLEGSGLEIEDVPVVVHCRNCRENITLDSLYKFVCPVCEKPAAEIVQGRELQVTALEIV